MAGVSFPFPVRAVLAPRCGENWHRPNGGFLKVDRPFNSPGDRFNAIIGRRMWTNVPRPTLEKITEVEREVNKLLATEKVVETRRGINYDQDHAHLGSFVQSTIKTQWVEFYLTGELQREVARNIFRPAIYEGEQILSKGSIGTGHSIEMSVDMPALARWKTVEWMTAHLDNAMALDVESGMHGAKIILDVD